jgi:sulfite exporter TauE/SafE
MDIALYISALTVGFLGSFHCVAMCGPIALVLPRKNGSKATIFSGRIFYNLGRIVTYMILGLIIGLIGFSFAIKGFQNELSIIAGISIILFVLFAKGNKHSANITGFIGKFTFNLKQQFKKLFGNGSRMSLFLIGLLNGLLPCGFVYLALAGALATGSYAGGMMYMGLFGLGTFPAMLAVSIAGHFIGTGFQKYMRKASPIIAIILALFLIQRGSDAKTKSCCQNHNKVVSCSQVEGKK